MPSDPRSGGTADSAHDDGRDFAVVCYREEGRWEIGLLPDRASADLEVFLAALRQQPGEGGVLGLLDIGDDFFVAARVQGEHVRLLLSDVSAAQAWPLAREVLQRIGINGPDDEELDADLDEIEPVGDLALLTDLGVSELDLGLLLADVDAYADEMLFSIADRLGFGEELEQLVGAAVH